MDKFTAIIFLAIIFSVLIKLFYIFSLDFILALHDTSMEPTIGRDQLFLVTKVPCLEKLSRGDIIVYYSENPNDKGLSTKRLIGVGGDRIKIIEGVIYLNGEIYEEPYVGQNSKETYFSGQEFEVPKGKLFLLRDNRTIPETNKFWFNPYVSLEEVVGKVRVIYKEKK